MKTFKEYLEESQDNYQVGNKSGEYFTGTGWDMSLKKAKQYKSQQEALTDIKKFKGIKNGIEVIKNGKW